jgi:hypothetical protein
MVSVMYISLLYFLLEKLYVVLEEDGEDQLDRLCEEWLYLESRRIGISYVCNKKNGRCVD